MNRRFMFLIVAAMVLGVAAGWAVNQYATPAGAKSAAETLSIVTEIFLRLIKMIIAPLVFSTLVAGIGRMEDGASIGRVGAKALGWFICASIVSLTIGLIMVHLLRPGSGLSLPLPDPAKAGAGMDVGKFTLKTFIPHIVPASVVQAMADNEILQIVVFSVFFGAAIAVIGEPARQVIALVEQITAITLKVTAYVMKTAPLAIFAALASTVATQGIGVLATYAKFVGSFYLSMMLLWVLLTGVLALIVGRRAWKLIAGIRQPALLAFSTASSEAAYPGTLEALESWGVSKRIASFILPLGYSFNMDGSMMYCTFATLFIARIYGVQLSIAQQVTMLFLLMITSKGVAGVPRASLVVIAATLSFFHLPEAGLLLILAVDHLLDMGRSATNVVGNSVAAAVIAKWEGQILEPRPAPAREGLATAR